RPLRAAAHPSAWRGPGPPSASALVRVCTPSTPRSRRGRFGAGRVSLRPRGSRGRRGGGVRTLTGPVAKACGYRRRGRAMKDARPGDVQAVRTGQPVAADLPAAWRRPGAALALQSDRGPPGSALLAPLLTKPLDQCLSLGLGDLNQVCTSVAIFPLDDC